MAANAVDKVFDELGKMSVLDLVELKKKIEDEWGITAAAPVAVAAPGAAAGGDGAAAPEEKTAFDVVLTAAGGQKIQVIKVVRAITGQGLRYTPPATSADSAGVPLRRSGVLRYPSGLRRSSCCPRLPARRSRSHHISKGGCIT